MMKCRHLIHWVPTTTHGLITTVIERTKGDVMSKLLTDRKICDVLGVSPAQLVRLVHRNFFPRPTLALGSYRAPRWYERDVFSFVNDLARSRGVIKQVASLDDAAWLCRYLWHGNIAFLFETEDEKKATRSMQQAGGEHNNNLTTKKGCDHG